MKLAILLSSLNVGRFSQFRKRLLLKIRPFHNSVYGISKPKGISYLTQLRVGLSNLNYHKFKHNFADTVSPMCLANDGIEDTEHVCCYATPLTIIDVVSSPVSMKYSRLLEILFVQMKVCCRSSYMEIKICLMMRTSKS